MKGYYDGTCPLCDRTEMTIFYSLDPTGEMFQPQCSVCLSGHFGRKADFHRTKANQWLALGAVCWILLMLVLLV